MPALRVALYARVSSDQTEQGTIASQVAALQARILQDGLPLEPTPPVLLMRGTAARRSSVRLLSVCAMR